MRVFCGIVVALATAGCSLPEAAVPEIGSSEQPAGRVAQMRLVDQESGEEFDALGRPGEPGASPLQAVAGYNQFWFAWSVFNHDSEIFGRSERVTTAPLSGDGECAVPCERIFWGCPGPDCIPALTRPEQVDPSSSDADYLEASSFVAGVAVGGDVRAYSHNVFWWHEIINDTVGGTPISVTHCPLTFSTLAHDPTAFHADGRTVELGVSGRLFNSNLVFYDRSDDTLYSQLLGVGTRGSELGNPAPRVPVFEMTWAAWQSLHPESTVVTGSTGYARTYTHYPYGSYFTDDSDTFSATEPAPDPTYPAKDLTYGVRIDGAAKAYPWSELGRVAEDHHGPRGVVNDRIGTKKVAVVFDLEAGYVQAFERTGQPDLELRIDQNP